MKFYNAMVYVKKKKNVDQWEKKCFLFSLILIMKHRLPEKHRNKPSSSEFVVLSNIELKLPLVYYKILSNIL